MLPLNGWQVRDLYDAAPVDIAITGKQFRQSRYHLLGYLPGLTLTSLRQFSCLAIGIFPQLCHLQQNGLPLYGEHPQAVSPRECFEGSVIKLRSFQIISRGATVVVDIKGLLACGWRCVVW